MYIHMTRQRRSPPGPIRDHHDGICASRVAEREQISAPTVSRTYAAFTQSKELEPEIKYQRRYIRALRKRPEKLSDYQKQSLAELFERYPVIEALYRKMSEICDLFNKKTQSEKSCRKHARSLVRHIQDLRAHLFDKLQTLAKTLTSWAEPIAAMWRFRKSNSITEGFHRKLKLIQRRAYGFRNFNNYRLRVIAQCG